MLKKCRDSLHNRLCNYSYKNKNALKPNSYVIGMFYAAFKLESRYKL
jgi:hypothetical protein